MIYAPSVSPLCICSLPPPRHMCSWNASASCIFWVNYADGSVSPNSTDKDFRELRDSGLIWLALALCFQTGARSALSIEGQGNTNKAKNFLVSGAVWKVGKKPQRRTIKVLTTAILNAPGCLCLILSLFSPDNWVGLLWVQVTATGKNSAAKWRVINSKEVVEIWITVSVLHCIPK